MRFFSELRQYSAQAIAKSVTRSVLIYWPAIKKFTGQCRSSKALLPNALNPGWMQKPVLSEIQSKILLALLVRGKVSSIEILQAVGISGSTWNKEKMLLQNTGLVESQITRELTENGVVRKMEFKLTIKGRQVAQNLLAISSLIGDESFATEKIESVLALIVKA